MSGEVAAPWGRQRDPLPDTLLLESLEAMPPPGGTASPSTASLAGQRSGRAASGRDQETAHTFPLQLGGGGHWGAPAEPLRPRAKLVGTESVRDVGPDHRRAAWKLPSTPKVTLLATASV